MDETLTRKDALKAMIATAAAASLPVGVLGQTGEKPVDEITLEDLKSIEKVAGLEFTDEERKQVLEDVRSEHKDILSLRKVDVEQRVAPAVEFRPLHWNSAPVGKSEVRTSSIKLSVAGHSDEDIAFLTAAELGYLIRNRQITSERLTKIYLDRLQKYASELFFLITLTPDLALRQARKADEEIAAGHYRGPLHGLPYGIKDLFDTKGIHTTFGAAPYRDRVPNRDATVVRRLEAAGAVLLGKLSMGALAMDDWWFGGQTKNPWNREQGSSGSSAGSASATASGCVAFAIGTETQGSITSPSNRCRVSGLRPTFGRVSRAGAMELSYTMDKVGPICRSAEDCAIVFAAICGFDPDEPTTVDKPFAYRPVRDLKGLKIGFEPGAEKIDSDPVVKMLRDGGASVVPHKFTAAPDGVGMVLDVECAAAFDDLTRSGRLSEMEHSLWPEFFRAARHLPAVDYVRAQKVRRVMLEQLDRDFGDLDLAIDYGIAENTIVQTNQAGTPQAIIPYGADEKGQSMSYSFLGRAYREGLLLQVANYVQRRTDFHRRRPPL